MASERREEHVSSMTARNISTVLTSAKKKEASDGSPKRSSLGHGSACDDVQVQSRSKTK